MEKDRDRSLGAAGNRRRRRLLWSYVLLIAPCAVSAVVLAPLAWIRKSAEVEIALAVSHASFVIGSIPDGLLHSLPVRSLTLVGFREVALPPGTLEVARPGESAEPGPEGWRAVAETTRAVISESRFSRMTLEDVTLNRLAVEPNSPVTISWDKTDPSTLILRLGSVSGEIAAGKALYFSCSDSSIADLPEGPDLDAERWRVVSDRRHELHFEGRREGATVALELPAEAGFIARDIPVVGGVDFTRMEGRRLLSTIHDAGRIFFEEIRTDGKRKEIGVSVGEFLVIGKPEMFYLKTLELDRGIRLTLHGRVGELATVKTGIAKDRLPSYLEWLFARETWVLYLNALAVVATTLSAIRLRLQTSHEKE